jgi:hypothetical protein
VAGPLGFKALPPLYLLTVVLIVVAYFAFAELTKRWFYRERGAQVRDSFDISPRVTYNPTIHIDMRQA